MRKTNALLLMCTLALIPAGVAACGSTDNNDAAIQAAEKRQQAIQKKLKEQQQQGLQDLRQGQPKATPPKPKPQGGGQAPQPEAPPPQPTTTTTAAPAPNCDPNYTGACLDPNASDYDCEGGSGDGPKYTGQVTVVGSDHYGLDSNSNGIGCE